jgi:hypothetical protein
MSNYPFRATALTPSTDEFAQRLSGAISFPSTILGNRHRCTWERLISYIASSGCKSSFENAAAYAEGYAQALVDSDQVDVSIERDLLIIETVDAWRHMRHDSNTSTYL